jgi:MoxR-like ATPase
MTMPVTEIPLADCRALIACRDTLVRVELPRESGRCCAVFDGSRLTLSPATSTYARTAITQAVAVAASPEAAEAWLDLLDRGGRESQTTFLAAVSRFASGLRVVTAAATDPALVPDGSLVPLDYRSHDALWDRISQLSAASANESGPAGTAAEVPPPCHDRFRFVADQVEMTVADLEDGMHVLYVGPTGTGKNTAAEAVFGQLGRPVEMIEGKENLDDLYVMGAIVPQDSGGLRWVDGPLARALRRAAEEPVLLWFNEVNRCQRKHLNLLISCLDPKPAALFASLGAAAPSPSGRYYSLDIAQTGERLIAPVEHFCVLAACNLGSQYAVADLDPALERRFATVIEFEYLEPEAEASLLLLSVPGLKPRVARAMASLAGQLRQGWLNAEYAAPLDTGRLIAWGRKLARPGAPLTVGQAELTARTTWVSSVAGRDHRGLVDPGVSQGILELVRDIVGGSL